MSQTFKNFEFLLIFWNFGVVKVFLLKWVLVYFANWNCLLRECSTCAVFFQVSEISEELATLPKRAQLAAAFITYLSAAPEGLRKNYLEEWTKAAGLESLYWIIMSFKFQCDKNGPPLRFPLLLLIFFFFFFNLYVTRDSMATSDLLNLMNFFL